MRLRSVLTGIAFVSVIAMASSAFAQSDCTKLVPVSPFGKDDQTGATNRITPAVTKAAAAEIKDGKVTSLTNRLVDGVPLFGTRFTKTVLTATGLAPGGASARTTSPTWKTPGSARATSARISTAWATSAGPTATTTRPPMGKYINQNNMTQARARAPEDLRHARRVHRPGQGLPAGEQAQEQCGLPHAVPRQGNGDHAGGSAGRPEDVQRRPCARATRVSCTPDGSTSSCSTRRRTPRTTAASPASA